MVLPTTPTKVLHTHTHIHTIDVQATPLQAEHISGVANDTD